MNHMRKSSPPRYMVIIYVHGGYFCDQLKTRQSLNNRERLTGRTWERGVYFSIISKFMHCIT